MKNRDVGNRLMVLIFFPLSLFNKVQSSDSLFMC
jgi:hypothetical protein